MQELLFYKDLNYCYEIMMALLRPPDENPQVYASFMSIPKLNSVRGLNKQTGNSKSNVRLASTTNYISLPNVTGFSISSYKCIIYSTITTKCLHADTEMKMDV